MRTKAAFSLILVAMAPSLVATSSEARERFLGGYACKRDCSAHAAGYAWAQRNRVVDSTLCASHPKPFAEGCQLYTENPVRGAEVDDDGHLIDHEA